jgi:glucose-6-phosphate 1-dehydrogenase
VDLALIFSEALRDLPEPFEQRLGDALQGEANLFTREDGVEKTWRIVQPLLDSPPPVETYAPGSWGPAGADKLLACYPHWREPWLHSHPTR